MQQLSTKVFKSSVEYFHIYIVEKSDDLCGKIAKVYH